jgi:beta-phosphoglucomutase-like phosphatase (HAD superfamily)
MIVAIIALAFFASVTAGLAGGLWMLWLHERESRDIDIAWEALDHHMDRHDQAYVRAALTQLHRWADKFNAAK